MWSSVIASIENHLRRWRDDGGNLTEPMVCLKNIAKEDKSLKIQVRTKETGPQTQKKPSKENKKKPNSMAVMCNQCGELSFLPWEIID